MTAKQQVVLITGASSGIGKETAEYLAGQGHRVFAGARRPEQVSIQGAECVRLDVTDDASVTSAVSHVLAAAGRIDALVNNAGGLLIGPVEESSIEQARSLFETNVLGVMRVSNAVLPAMRRQGAGRIVNVSSILGFLPAPYMGVYAATKHAVEGLSESMDHEVRGFGVRVVLVEPGLTKTNIDATAAHGDIRVEAYTGQRERTEETMVAEIAEGAKPLDVAKIIERALSTPRFARLPVGRQAALLSRLRRWAPPSIVDGAIRKTFGLTG